jgi:hypothetical protein
MTPLAIRRIAFVLLVGLAPASAHALTETLTLRSASVPSGGITTATLTLDAAAVRDKSYSVSVQGSNAAKVPSRVEIRAGQTRVEFPVTAAAAATSQFADIHVSEPGSSVILSRVRLGVTPPTLLSLALNRSEVVGGTTNNTVTGTVTLDGVAAGVGLNVELGQTCSNCFSARGEQTQLLGLPSAVRVSGGARTGSFNIVAELALSTKQYTVSAGMTGVVKSAPLANLSLRPLSMTVSPTTIAGSQAVSATIALNAPAYAGYKMTLTCSALLDVVTSVGNVVCPPPGSSKELALPVPAGQASFSFQLLRGQVSPPTQVTVRAEPLGMSGNVQAVVSVAP